MVVKLAAPAAVRREERALARVAALGVAPPVAAAGEGVLVTRALPGAPLPADRWGAPRARALGALIARVHGALPAPAGTYDGWDEEVDHLGAYRDRRAGGGGGDPPPAGGGDGFAWLHGDLWSGNVVWDDERPRLVDWEFARPGDPAEDLAYLAAMDDLGAPALAALIEGYAPDDPATLARAVAWWRPVLAAECAAWFDADGDHARAAALAARAWRGGSI